MHAQIMAFLYIFKFASHSANESNTLNCTTMDGNKCDLSQTGLHLHHRLVSINEAFSWLLRRRSVLPHSSSKWLKPAKNKLLKCELKKISKQFSNDSYSFRFRLLRALIIQRFSNYCSRFHEFFDPIFSGFCDLVQLCA